MKLNKVKTADLLDELQERFDHVVIYLIQDKEGGTHIRRWRGNYHACMSMCGVIHSYILDAYKATSKILSKEKG